MTGFTSRETIAKVLAPSANHNPMSLYRKRFPTSTAETEKTTHTTHGKKCLTRNRRCSLPTYISISPWLVPSTSSAKILIKSLERELKHLKRPSSNSSTSTGEEHGVDGQFTPFSRTLTLVVVFNTYTHPLLHTQTHDPRALGKEGNLQSLPRHWVQSRKGSQHGNA